jgi:hypothetical protein
MVIQNVEHIYKFLAKYKKMFIVCFKNDAKSPALVMFSF